MKRLALVFAASLAMWGLLFLCIRVAESEAQPAPNACNSNAPCRAGSFTTSGSINANVINANVIDAGTVAFSGSVTGNLRVTGGEFVAGVADAGAFYTVGTIGAAGEVHAPGGIDGGAIRLNAAANTPAIVITNDNAKLQMSTTANTYFRAVAADNTIYMPAIFNAGQVSSQGAHTGVNYYSDRTGGATAFLCNVGSCAIEYGTNGAEKITGAGASGLTASGAFAVTTPPATNASTGTGVGNAKWNALRNTAHYQWRRWMSLSVAGTASTTFSGVGMTVPTVQGTASAAPATDTSMMMISYASDPTTNSLAGLEGGAGGGHTRFSYLPMMTGTIRTGSSIAAMRIYVGLESTTLSNKANLAATDTVTYSALRYDTGIGDTEWMACSSEGTTASCTTTGVTVAINTTYRMSIDCSVAGTCDYYVNDTDTTPAVSKSSNISTSSATDIRLAAVATTLENVAKDLLISGLGVGQNK